MSVLPIARYRTLNNSISGTTVPGLSNLYIGFTLLTACIRSRNATKALFFGKISTYYL